MTVRYVGEEFDPDSNWPGALGQTTDVDHLVTISVASEEYDEADTGVPPDEYLRLTIVHEIGHAALWSFQRDRFGNAAAGDPNADHSPLSIAGIMNGAGAGAETQFSPYEQHLLRGWNRSNAQ